MSVNCRLALFITFAIDVMVVAGSAALLWWAW